MYIIKDMSKKLLTIIGLSIIATFNAIYLTFNAYSVKAVKVFWQADAPSTFCDLSSTFSCSSVFTHDFAWIFGIPFALIAAFVYPTIIAIAIFWFLGKIKSYYKVLFFVALAWILFNSYIIYNEVLVWTYCLLCAACSVIIVTIAILAKVGYCEEKKKKPNLLGKIKSIFKKK